MLNFFLYAVTDIKMERPNASVALFPRVERGPFRNTLGPTLAPLSEIDLESQPVLI